MPLLRGPGGAGALQTGRQYLAFIGVLLKVLGLSDVTGLALKLPPVALVDL